MKTAKLEKKSKSSWLLVCGTPLIRRLKLAHSLPCRASVQKYITDHVKMRQEQKKVAYSVNFLFEADLFFLKFVSNVPSDFCREDP